MKEKINMQEFMNMMENNMLRMENDVYQVINNSIWMD